MNNEKHIYYFKYDNTSKAVTTEIFDIVDTPADTSTLLPSCADPSDYIFMKSKSEDYVRFLSKTRLNKADNIKIKNDTLSIGMWSDKNDKKTFENICYDAICKYIAEQEMRAVQLQHNINTAKRLSEDFCKYTENKHTLNKDTIDEILRCTELRFKDIPELENYKSDDGSYTIPVEWSVYSTVTVKNADNLADAIGLVADNIDIIPYDPEPQNIDGTYKIAIETVDDAKNAQAYQRIGSIYFDENREIQE